MTTNHKHTHRHLEDAAAENRTQKKTHFSVKVKQVSSNQHYGWTVLYSAEQKQNNEPNRRTKKYSLTTNHRTIGIPMLDDRHSETNVRNSLTADQMNGDSLMPGTIIETNNLS